MIDLRVRSKISPQELEAKVGKIVTDADYNVLLTGPTRVAMADGRPLCIYLPGVVEDLVNQPDIYDVLHSLKSMVTDNRGNASGSVRLNHGDKRTRAKRVSSVMLGTFDPKGGKQFCRLSSWTSKNLPKYQTLEPLLQGIAQQFAQHSPQRYQRQMAEVAKCDPNWCVPGTPFTTITVNNTYPTGVHQDSGDLEAGFSTLAVCRRGQYTGGVVVFPEYRVGVDMQDGDLLLMDAHQWHGNTMLRPRIVQGSDGEPVWDCERISVVSYFRTGTVLCGTPDEEHQKAAAYAERGGTR